MRVRTSAELLLDSCRSRENCARRWLVSLHDRELVNDSERLSVATFSSPFSLIAKVVIGLAGSKKTKSYRSFGFRRTLMARNSGGLVERWSTW